MLTINEACKAFGATQVLDKINLKIQANTVTGLAGSSGSGKSTLLRCIQGLDQVDSGSIKLSGKSGFMFQDFQLFPHMTVEQNLIYAPKLHNKIKKPEEQAQQLLATLGIADKALVYPCQLSGGQKQRVALARSLMMNPSLLLCDEPTSGLDLAAIDDVLSLLNSIKTMGMTLVIASHDLDFLSKVTDRLIILKKGKLAADLNPKKLIEPINNLKQYYQE